MPNMKLIPTRAGYVYECVECDFQLTPEQADEHECMTVFSF